MYFDDAFVLAAWLHKGQRDKAGAPYSGHLWRVASKVPAAAGPDAKIAALLHDAIEDGKADANELLACGVPPSVVAIVELLTRRPGESYLDYLARVRSCPAAVAVKRADIADNADEARLALLPADEAARLRAKYAAALEALDA